jgi:hypothetical protein
MNTYLDVDVDRNMVQTSLEPVHSRGSSLSLIFATETDTILRTSTYPFLMESKYNGNPKFLCRQNARGPKADSDKPTT